jgi:peptidyl-prolyl cis-trans isomerase C
MKSTHFAIHFSLGFIVASLIWMSPSLFQKFEQFTHRFSTGEGRDPVVAHVGPKIIRRSDLLSRTQISPSPAQPQDLSPDKVRAALNGLVYQKAIIVLADRAGIHKDPDYLKAVEPFMEAQLSRIYTQRVQREISVTDDEIRAYYKAHEQNYIQGIIHASHIVTRTMPEADRAYKKLKSGLSFAQVAREISIDRASAHQGGKVTVRTGKADPAFESLIRSMKKGEIIYLARTQAGYEIIRKDEDIVGTVRPLVDMKDEIRNRLQVEKMAKKLNEEISSLKVSIDEDQLKSLTRPPSKS